MKKTANLFNKNQLIDIFMPDLEHYYFFHYLHLSPSYQLAYLKMELKEIIKKDEIPVDFSLVKKTYQIVGNIFDIDFATWWIKVGHKIFKDTGLSKISIIANLDKPKETVLAEVSSIINRAYQLKKRNQKFSIRLMPSKIRPSTLEARWMLAREKGDFAFKDFSFTLPGWRYADMAQVNSKYQQAIHALSMPRKTSANEYARKYLTMLVGKQINEALSLAENAARGKFPTYEKGLSNLKFNYYHIGFFYNVERRAFPVSTPLEIQINRHIRNLELKYNVRRRISESVEFKSIQKRKKEFFKRSSSY